MLGKSSISAFAATNWLGLRRFGRVLPAAEISELA